MQFGPTVERFLGHSEVVCSLLHGHVWMGFNLLDSICLEVSGVVANSSRFGVLLCLLYYTGIIL